MRDIYTDPRPGDQVQVIPDICDRLPEPMQILEVDERGVRWRRPLHDQEEHTPWSIWQSNGSAGCRRTLELVEVGGRAGEQQFDLFGEVA
ncbi:hypothetical protein [Chromohalobacter sp. 296-RDG]|uniref:hypothetical protein n=1 Tax=Chromohalobacter sp. 296-RDG TaxID=2994062 RepID=UPI00246945C7|nr:hypothetical protein [Chromohalobacter sp. 296-RDG]